MRWGWAAGYVDKETETERWSEYSWTGDKEDGGIKKMKLEKKKDLAGQGQGRKREEQEKLK